MCSAKHSGLIFMRNLAGCNYFRISVIQSEIPVEELLARS